jgi:hypothetical protein
MSKIEEFLERLNESVEGLNVSEEYFVDGVLNLLCDLEDFSESRRNAEEIIEKARKVNASGKKVPRFVKVLATCEDYPEKRTAVWVAYFTADNDCYDCLLPKPEAV